MKKEKYIFPDVQIFYLNIQYDIMVASASVTDPGIQDEKWDISL